MPTTASATREHRLLNQAENPVSRASGPALAYPRFFGDKNSCVLAALAPHTQHRGIGCQTRNRLPDNLRRPQSSHGTNPCNPVIKLVLAGDSRIVSRFHAEGLDCRALLS